MLKPGRSSGPVRFIKQLQTKRSTSNEVDLYDLLTNVCMTILSLLSPLLLQPQ